MKQLLPRLFKAQTTVMVFHTFAPKNCKVQQPDLQVLAASGAPKKIHHRFGAWLLFFGFQYSEGTQ